MKSINKFINESNSDKKLFEGFFDFFGELKDTMKSGVNAMKEQKEILAQIFSAKNLSKLAKNINTELLNSGETKENKEIKKVFVKFLLPEFEDAYEKSKYVKKFYSLDEWRKMSTESIDDFFKK